MNYYFFLLGPAVAIKNSSLMAVTIMSWIFLDQPINVIQWFFIIILIIGLIITGAGDSILKSWHDKHDIAKIDHQKSFELKFIKSNL